MGKSLSSSPGAAASSALLGCLALCLALQVPRLESARFTVSGPDRPVIVSLGGEAVLPCHLSPVMSAETMEVRWFRSQCSAVVHLYHNGQEQYGQQMPEYQGRTQLLKDDITSRRVSLRIRNIQPSDDGQYKCFFQSSVSYEDAILELQVADLGSAPAIYVEGHQDGGIRLVCRSSGWYPQPEVLWRDHRGQRLPSASENTSPGANGLFQTETAIIITEESNQKVSCCVRNPRLNQQRESEISIAGLFFPRANPWLVVLAVILALLAVLIPLASYCFWRQHREKGEVRTRRGSLAKKKYKLDVTLDADTAHPKLLLSEDRKRVRYRDRQQVLPKNPERFLAYPVVLGAEGFRGGRRYWEVEVEEEAEWYLGVCKENVSRTEKITASPENGYWTIRLWDGEYVACTCPRICLPLNNAPGRVGVFLDYEAGEVSFYNVTDRSHLFTFNDTFDGGLRPYFSLSTDAGGTNAAPLTICPLPAQAGVKLCPRQ
ncbi:butyrophilin subfamily 1 member A1-like [Carettochelys insculpta]|uniref:butyrophilin subfamily 1 member A1-like n=1 Tax=Carettochelys insculpta TaxID=44489 RepID=UPI003EBC705D